MKIKKTVIITGYRCNNFCRFCLNNNKRELPERKTDEILLDIYRARARGSTYLEVIGGEQTMRPDIEKIINSAKKMGFSRIAMATNGRLFAYRDFAARILNAGLTDLIFSIHGHAAKLHDSLTMAEGSFKQLIKGIQNIKKIGSCDIGSNTAIVKQNYKQLPKIGEFIYGLGIRNAEFIYVDPSKGGAFDHFEELVPMVSEAAPYIRKCLDIGRTNGARHWHIRYVPLCYFKGYENQISEIHEIKTFDSEHIGLDFRNFDVAKSRAKIGRIKPGSCNQCEKYNICEGIWKEYYRRYGSSELKPIK